VVGTPQVGLAVVVLTVIIICVVFANDISPYPPHQLDIGNRFATPSGRHWFGTDELGRDMFSRILYGGRLALTITFGSTMVAMVVGLTWGFVAAEASGRVESSLMRLADVAMAIPIVMFALILVAAFGSTLLTLTFIIGILLAPGTARIARSSVLAELKSDYYLALVAVGVPRWRLLVGELLPNTAPTAIARASLVSADVLMIEASLSFLGLGVAPPSASWGTLLREGYTQIYNSLGYVIFPAAMIVVVIWAFNTLGDRLQALLDPRSI